MKYILLSFVIVFISAGCSNKNMMYYKYKRYHWEFDYIENDKNEVHLNQVICSCDGNPKTTVDARTCRELTFTIIDSVAAIEKRKLDLVSDTNIIKCNYKVCYSVASDCDEDCYDPPIGHIKIIYWTKNKIMLKENISVFDKRNNKTLKFQGFRVFKRDWG